MAPIQKFLIEKKKAQTLEEIAEKTHLAARNLQRIIKGEVKTPRLYTIKRISAAYGRDYREFLTPDAAPDLSRLSIPQINRLAYAFRVAIWHSLQNGRDVIRGFSGRPIQRTAGTKITSLDPEKDPTHPIDAETTKAIRKVLDKLPAFDEFAEGFHLITEEDGYTDRYVVREADPDIILFEDSADDTSKAERGLGGTSLISAYQLGVGWIAAAIGDFSRNNLYWRVGNSKKDKSVAMHLALNGDHGLSPPSRDFHEPRGYAFPLSPTNETVLDGVAINIYTGHAPRVILTAQKGKDLIDAMGPTAAVFSEGGSRGPLLVAEGWMDASVEFTKGFRPLDFVPGAFIAAGAGAEIRELPSGNPISFGVDEDFEAKIQKYMDTSDNMLFEELRKKFVVASTAELAIAIIRTLRNV